MRRLLLLLVAVAALATGGTASGEGHENAWSPPWRIVYESEGGLDVLSSETQDPRRLLRLEDNEIFALSPDGRLVAYATRAGLFVFALDGKSRRRLLAGSGLGAILWAPDGSSIAFSRGCGNAAWQGDCDSVSIVPSRGGRVRRVFKVVGQSEPFVHTTSWSPDGRELLVWGASALWLVRADASGSRRLSRAGDGFVGDASFSPDGTRIAYTRACKAGLGDDLFCDVAVMNRNGNGKRTLLDGQADAYAAPLWTSGDSVVVSEWGFGSHMTVLNMRNGTSRRLLGEPGRHLTAGASECLSFTYQPDWGVVDRFVVLDRSGRRLVQRSVPFRFEAAASIWLG